MKNLIKFASIIALSSSLSSCSILEELQKGKKVNLAQKPLDSLSGAPSFKVDKFLDGDLDGFAIIQNSDGKIIDSFNVSVNGDWEGKRGTIKFRYKYNNNKKDSRTWLITSEDSNNFGAIGHDFLSPGKGRQSGNVSEIIYSLSKEHNGQKQKIDFVDYFYLVDKNSAIITSEMKSGNDMIGKITLSLSKKIKIKTKKVVQKKEVKNEEQN